ncbi:hypothetical protein SRHO_G00240170 [Serrasalmus rhombeus]
MLYSLYIYACVDYFDSTTIVITKFADDTVEVGLISENDEKAYLEEIMHLGQYECPPLCNSCVLHAGGPLQDSEVTAAAALHAWLTCTDWHFGVLETWKEEGVQKAGDAALCVLETLDEGGVETAGEMNLSILELQMNHTLAYTMTSDVFKLQLRSKTHIQGFY